LNYWVEKVDDCETAWLFILDSNGSGSHVKNTDQTENHDPDPVKEVQLCKEAEEVSV
jgi:hypothetical protein